LIPVASNSRCIAVSDRFKPGETGKPLIGTMKLPAVSLFHDFREHRPRNSNRDRPADLKIPSGLPLKTVKQRNRQQFIQQYQNLVCFSRFETG
jgi:hypothetical protein